jgi:hypothetical protein
MQPTRGSAVPKFGDWDANPASADGYTHIFNKVREEKQTTQAGKPAAYGKDGMRTNGPKQHDDDGYVSSVSAAHSHAPDIISSCLFCRLTGASRPALLAEILVLWVVQVETDCLMNGDDGWMDADAGSSGSGDVSLENEGHETISMIFPVVDFHFNL